MFHNVKMGITENKAKLKFTTEKYFCRKMSIFPDFTDIQPKFPDSSLISRLAVKTVKIQKRRNECRYEKFF